MWLLNYEDFKNFTLSPAYSLICMTSLTKTIVHIYRPWAISVPLYDMYPMYWHWDFVFTSLPSHTHTQTDRHTHIHTYTHTPTGLHRFLMLLASEPKRDLSSPRWVKLSYKRTDKICSLSARLSYDENEKSTLQFCRRLEGWESLLRSLIPKATHKSKNPYKKTRPKGVKVEKIEIFSSPNLSVSML